VAHVPSTHNPSHLEQSLAAYQPDAAGSHAPVLDPPAAPILGQYSAQRARAAVPAVLVQQQQNEAPNLPRPAQANVQSDAVRPLVQQLGLRLRR
jgi:hypothetical protein